MLAQVPLVLAVTRSCFLCSLRFQAVQFSGLLAVKLREDLRVPLFELVNPARVATE
jgi:hypothetical protein